MHDLADLGYRVPLSYFYNMYEIKGKGFIQV